MLPSVTLGDVAIATGIGAASACVFVGAGSVGAASVGAASIDACTSPSSATETASADAVVFALERSKTIPSMLPSVTLGDVAIATGIGAASACIPVNDSVDGVFV